MCQKACLRAWASVKGTTYLEETRAHERTPAALLSQEQYDLSVRNKHAQEVALAGLEEKLVSDPVPCGKTSCPFGNFHCDAPQQGTVAAAVMLPPVMLVYGKASP